MSKAGVSSGLVLFLGLSALVVFGQFSHFGDNGPNASTGQGEMAVQTNVTKTFMAQDGANSCTVMSIYNPTLTDAKVKIVGYRLTGLAYCEYSITVPKKYVVRVCSDMILTNTNGWVNAQMTDFGDTVGYAKITCPSTLKIEAYIA
jgi:hypothetical protein